MAAALLGHPRPQYTLDSPLGAINAGGELLFYITGTLTPKNVYSDAALGTSLGASVTLDAAGRTPTAIFGDGAYRVVEMDANGAQVNATDGVNIQGAPAITFPDPADGNEDDVLGTDGVSYLFRAIREVPDPTGHSGKYVGTDGELVQWTAFPAAVVYDDENLPGGVDQGASSIQIGKQLRQCGSGTIASTNALTGNVAIVWATPFASLLHVSITLTGSGGSTPQGAKPGISYVGTPTGMTVYAYAADEHDTPGWLLTGATTFTYEAIGLVA